jgi:hypothetical protein
MNRKAYAGVLAFLTCLALGSLTGCSSSSSPSTGTTTPTVAITANTGYTASAALGGSYGTFSATVTSNGSPASGVSVTFAAPTSGASGTFATSPAAATDTETTNSSGVATSQVFTANTTAGSYTVTATATATGASTPANFNLTNTGAAAPTVTLSTPPPSSMTTGQQVTIAATTTDTAGVKWSCTTTGATACSSANFNPTSTLSLATTVFTAPAGAETVTVTATSVSDSSVSANASVTVTTAVATVNTYVFYLTGQEDYQGAPFYYALAGAVTIDSNGNVVVASGNTVAGEQDYNDGAGFTSPEPLPDTITGGTLSVNSSTGQGTLILNTSDNTDFGGPATETFGIQFVNANHALITQFDGNATSSGSLDLQTLVAPSGGYAFTLSGVDVGYQAVAYGGVFTVTTGGSFLGTVDVNDAANSTPLQGLNLSGTFSTPSDNFGRGTITGVTVNGNVLALNYYIVGPEAIRIIDVDAYTGQTSGTGSAAIGSAFGQGSVNGVANTFSLASLGSSVFGEAGNGWVFGFAALGEFSTDTSNGTIPTGVADDNELVDNVQVPDSSISGSTYAIASNGYGSLAISNLGDVGLMGMYMTDPNLNLNDPNNTTAGSAVGGALLLDLGNFPGSTGLVTPQTDNTTASFNGSYAVGWQDFNTFYSGCSLCEFDMVAQGSMTNGTLSLTGLVSDPFFTLTTTATTMGDTFSGTPLADTPPDGRYALNPLTGVINVTPPASGPFDVVIYQANGGQLFWIETDDYGVFLGPLEQQPASVVFPAARKPAAKTQPKQKQ